EHLAQMPLDRSRADEQLTADLRVREAVACEPSDLLFLWRECLARLRAALPDLLTRRFELSAGTFGERLHPDRGEHVVGGSKLVTRLDTASFAAKPLATDQVRASELGTELGTTEPLDRLAVEIVRGCVIEQQGAGTRLGRECPIRPGRNRDLGKSLDGRACELLVPRPRGRLDELAQRPHVGVGIEVVRRDLTCRGRRLLVARQAVVQGRCRPLGYAHGEPLRSVRTLLDDGPD